MCKKILFLLMTSIGLILIMHLVLQNIYAQDKFQTEKEGDVEVISNPRFPTQSTDLSIMFKEEISIGEIEGDENYMFGKSLSFNADDEGYFYVTNYEDRKILKYSPEGEFILSIGRKGQGPGEFQNLTMAKFDESGSLYVLDSTSRKISFFTKDGKYIRQISLDGRFPDFLFINSDGNIVARKWRMTQEANFMKQISIFGLFNEKSEIIEELYKDELDTPLPTGSDESSLAQYLANVLSLTAFMAEPTLLLDNHDYIYFGFPNDYEIKVFSPKGKIARIIRREYEPIHINKEDKEEYLKNTEQRHNAIGNFPQGIIKEAMTKVKFPKHRPPYKKFLLMENGWLFVIVDSIPDKEALIDIFDQDGKYIAQFETVISTEGLFFKNGKAYAVASEDDYKFVKRFSYEIQKQKSVNK